MRRLPLMWAAALMVLGSGGGALGAGSAPGGVPAADGIRRVTLPNGLRLVLAPDDRATAVDVAVWYDAGARYERPGKSGLAHVFEHLMFRGSANVALDEHTRLIRAEGGTSGAYAALDFTCFYETLPPDALELAFRLEADRMTGLRITPEGLDTERRNVAAEWARRTTVVSRGLERIYAQAYAQHPYRRPIYGERRELAGLTLQDAREFYRLHFGPSHAVVTVVGRFRPEDALALAKKYFDGLEPTGPRVTVGPGMEKPQTSERRAVEIAPSPVRILMVGWRVPPRKDPDWPALNLLSVVLARGTGSRLARALVTERALCLSVQGGLDNHRDESLLYVSAPAAAGADSAEVESRFFGVIAKMMAEPVSADELERAKRQMEIAVWLGLQTSRGRAQALGHAEMLAGDSRDAARDIERIRACTAEDLVRAARDLDPARRDVVWLLPTPSGSTGGRP